MIVATWRRIEWIGRQINKWSEGGREDSTGWKQKEWRIIARLVLSPAERFTSTMAFSWYRMCVCMCVSVSGLKWPSDCVSCWSFLWALTDYTHSSVYTHTHIACLWQYNIQGPLSTHPLQCRGKIGRGHPTFYHMENSGCCNWSLLMWPFWFHVWFWFQIISRNTVFKLADTTVIVIGIHFVELCLWMKIIIYISKSILGL